MPLALGGYSSSPMRPATPRQCANVASSLMAAPVGSSPVAPDVSAAGLAGSQGSPSRNLPTSSS